MSGICQPPGLRISAIAQIPYRTSRIGIHKSAFLAPVEIGLQMEPAGVNPLGISYNKLLTLLGQGTGRWGFVMMLLQNVVRN
jgi:hypothetical protein